MSLKIFGRCTITFYSSTNKNNLKMLSRDSSETLTSKKGGYWETFKQQNTTAWELTYSALAVSPYFILIGIVLIPIGVLVLIISTESSADIKQYQIDYTYCQNVKNNSSTCADYITNPEIWENEFPEVCQCEVEFELLKPMKGEKIYMYYRLENFYQNIRQYLKSRDDDQLLGKIVKNGKPVEPNKDCEPLHKDSEGRIILPCGALANSMFNDSIQLYYIDNILGEVKIKQERKGIAWPSDKKYRFRNPPEFANPNDPIWQKFTKPRDWNRTIWDLDPEDPDNNGIQNEDLIVWMRPATFSTFQKLYRIIESSSQEIQDNGLPKGKYKLRINYTYEVTSFNGRKGITLSAPTLLGQQNYFQGISSVSVGGIYFVAGLLMLLVGCKSRHGKGAFLKDL